MNDAEAEKELRQSITHLFFLSIFPLVEAWERIKINLNELFEPVTALEWLDKPNPALENKRPKELLKTPGGVIKVANVLENFGH